VNEPEKEKKPAPDLDAAAIEREVLADRDFSIAEAIGRMGGKDLLKGASPVGGKDQARLALRHALREHLPDPERALKVVLLRRLVESEALLSESFQNPTELLIRYVDRMLDSDDRLRHLVREADIEWGRANQTRPFFEKEGEPPHPDDPYTSASVRTQLTRLRERLDGA
jgi:hypothetical protein